MLENKILETIKKYNLITSGDTILVAVSGGPDSMCLLDNLLKLKDVLEVKEIVVAHLNHMIRQEAKEETEYVEEYCNKNNIRCFVKYEDIIKKAVFNHNKANIDESVTGQALLFSKIIRDADKLDIYRVINEDKMKDIFWYKEFDNLKMSEGLMDKFINDKFISYKDIHNNADLIYVFYGYVYDFNFSSCFKIIKENKYLDNFLIRIKDTFKSDEITQNTEKLLKICNKYMDEKIEK